MARKPTRPKIGIKVHYSEQKIVLHTTKGKKCIIRPILVDGGRFEFEYMHTLIVFKSNTLKYEAYDKLGIAVEDFELDGDVRELFYYYSQIMLSSAQKGYKSATKGFESEFSSQVDMFDEVPRR